MAGHIGGPRHYSGPAPQGPFKWTCAGCGTEHVTKFELGCASCGAGTAQQAAAPVARKEVSVERLTEAVVGGDTTGAPVAVLEGDEILSLPILTRAARLSVAVALAHYADHGSAPSTEELPRIVALSWARYIHAAIEAEDNKGVNRE